ncbi:MAG: hypothetical protein WA858_00900 [Xanthobacteraceae bacterium]|jgi:hypothetical protein
MRFLPLTVAASSVLLAALAFPGAAPAADDAVTPQAQQIFREIDAMGVESKWIAGEHVYWESGLPTGVPETSPGKHTHCSAFVAAAAKKLGIYILRPPEHGQQLLANAQNDWLAEEGSAHGWRKLADAREAQAAANRGMLVVASYHNHHDDRPGHIAIIRPGTKTSEQIAAEGPDVTQAGSKNATSISIKAGFAGHPAAWRDNEIAYYAHEVKL